MHMVHLAIIIDTLASVLLDLTDPECSVWSGSSRDERLAGAWSSYDQFCREAQVPDRAEHKAFTREALVAASAYPSLSQKYVSATASRYIVFWLRALLTAVLAEAEWAANTSFQIPGSKQQIVETLLA